MLKPGWRVVFMVSEAESEASQDMPRCGVVRVMTGEQRARAHGVEGVQDHRTRRLRGEAASRELRFDVEAELEHPLGKAIRA